MTPNCPAQKGAQQPDISRSMSVMAIMAEWIQDHTRCHLVYPGIDHSPGHMVDGNPPTSSERGTAAPPFSRPMSIVAVRSPI